MDRVGGSLEAVERGELDVEEGELLESVSEGVREVVELLLGEDGGWADRERVWEVMEAER